MQCVRRKYFLSVKNVDMISVFDIIIIHFVMKVPKHTYIYITVKPNPCNFVKTNLFGRFNTRLNSKPVTVEDWPKLHHRLNTLMIHEWHLLSNTHSINHVIRNGKDWGLPPEQHFYQLIIYFWFHGWVVVRVEAGWQECYSRTKPKSTNSQNVKTLTCERTYGTNRIHSQCLSTRHSFKNIYKNKRWWLCYKER